MSLSSVSLLVERCHYFVFFSNTTFSFLLTATASHNLRSKLDPISRSDKELDLCPKDPNKIKPGICGCGYSDRANENGEVDCVDKMLLSSYWKYLPDYED